MIDLLKTLILPVIESRIDVVLFAWLCELTEKNQNYCCDFHVKNCFLCWLPNTSL